MPNDGFHMSLSIQSAFQTRDIDASCRGLGLNKYYEGKGIAPVIPSLFAAYKMGDWTISGFFGITGGGGKASFDERSSHVRCYGDRRIGSPKNSKQCLFAEKLHGWQAVHLLCTVGFDL